MVGVNLTGFFWLTQRAIAEMLQRYGGHVVNISATIAGYANSSVPSVLAALTKGGLASATRSLAVEYASRGIRDFPVERLAPWDLKAKSPDSFVCDQIDIDRQAVWALCVPRIPSMALTSRVARPAARP